MPSFRKIVRAVTEIWWWHPEPGILSFSKYSSTRSWELEVENCNVHKCTISTSRASLYNLKSNNQNRTNGQKSKFWKFLGIIYLILHNDVIEPGNFWLWNGPKPSIRHIKVCIIKQYQALKIEKLVKNEDFDFFMHN